MAGIHVFSEILKGGNKLGKASTPKGKDVSDSPDNVAAVFAAMMSGFTNSNVDPKGQNSMAGQESEEKLSPLNPVPSVQNPNEQGSLPGYGNYAFINLIQPMLQSNLPAGKEANSGNVMSQGTEGLANANEVLLNLVSLISDKVSAQSGMTTSKPQGDNPGITELDKYRQVIANLLVALSGEITDPSSKGNLAGSESVQTKDIGQEVAKIVQGWMMVTDEVVKDASVVGANIKNGQKEIIQPLLNDLIKGIGTGNPAFTEKVATLLAELNPYFRQGTEIQKVSQDLNQVIEVEGNLSDPAAKGSSESTSKPLIGNNLSLVAATQAKDTAFMTNIQKNQQKSSVMDPKLTTPSNGLQGNFREEVQGAGLRSTEVSGMKDIKYEYSSVAIGVANNFVAVNISEGKTVSVPVWEQISTAFRQQVTNRHQELKELDIQLHPADLGKIQIGMRWENGQVHLQVQASDAATGQLLQKQLSELRQNLTDRGVNCGMLQMGQGGERQHNPQGDEAQRTFSQNTRSNEDEDLIPVTNPRSLGRDEINRINVMA